MRNFTDIFDKKDYILKLLRKQDITEEDKAYVKKCLTPASPCPDRSHDSSSPWQPRTDP